MKRKYISMVIAVTIIASLFAAPVLEVHAGLNTDTTSGNLIWRINTTTGQLSVTGTGTMNNWTATGAPWYNHRAIIKSATIDARIIRIGNNAFGGCVNLKNVTANGVVAIGDNAFSGCISLESIDIADSMPNVTTIGDFVFNGCSDLKSINIPENVTSIGHDIFIGCRNLETITFTGSLNQSANGIYRVDSNGVLHEFTGANPTRAMKAPIGLSEYTIEDTVVRIDAEAFAYSDMVNVVIPASVNSIGRDAFSWSVFLKKATFEGHAPQTLPSGTRQLFENVASGFIIYYYPYTLRWPTPPSTNWRGYTAIAMTSYVTLDRSVVALELDKTTRLQATVHPTNASQIVTWSTNDPAVATVTPEGVVHARSLGTAIITVTAEGGQTATCRVQVVEAVVPVTSVILNKNQMTLTMNGASDSTLAAVIYPLDATNKGVTWSSSNTNVAYVDDIPFDPEAPGSGSATPTSLQRLIVPVAPGATTITVRTQDGNKVATCVVTVTARPTFIPVSSISLTTTTIATGATIDMSELARVQPSNATNKDITWEISSHSLTPGLAGGIFSIPTITPGGALSVPFGQTGTIVLEATIANGLAEIERVGEDGNTIEWGYPENIDYIRSFTINVVSFLPVTSITGLPTQAYAGVPLQLSGTVNPASASYRTIKWSVGGVNTAEAYLDPVTGVLLAQRPGTVSIIATVENGVMSGDKLGNYTQTFSIRVNPYITYALDLRANPGGSVRGADSGQYASGEKITITAIPSHGYIFSGWHSENGGEFTDASHTTTVFTMPGNATTVTAFFTYTGIPAGSIGDGGGIILPTPVHYFTNSSVYTKNTTVTFGHVTLRDYQLFSHVSLNGVQLTRGSHYTASRLSGYTEIIFANGYLDTLNQGAHTLTVHFSDHVTVSAVFTILSTSHVSQLHYDVFSSDWYFASVEYVSSRGWMAARSWEPGRFRPNDPVTQGEVIDALYRMTGTPTVINANGQPLQGRDAALEWVLANGILPTGGSYNLDSSITRQDIALLLAQLVTALRLRYPVVRSAPNFTDEWQIAIIARTPVTNLYRAAIINGRTSATFVPMGNMTRAEFATILNRFAEAMSGF